jgi:hypothetical protein
MDEQLQIVLERHKDASVMNSGVDIYENQIEAFIKIVQIAIHCPYVALVAQMQSGKTDTFLLCAFEYLRFDMVDQVVIFSGNSDLELKKQTIKSIDDFAFKYSNYLESLKIDRREAQLIYQNQKPKIKVVWSNDLTKCVKTTENTLYIWEESHYAQSIDMLPHHFLKTIDLSLSGKAGKFIEKRNYFISVSATPFSEIANIIIQKQEKKIVYLIPSEQYKGVQYFLENNMIVGHKNMDVELRRAIISAESRVSADKHIYGIVRCYEKLENEFSNIALQCGWIVKHYNMEQKEVDIGLPIEPQQNTLVFIKGALRMGKQVCKEHVGFVFETSENSNTDTVLQGLLGRMCSFTDVNHVKIYIHDNVINSGELEKYVKFIKGISEDNTPKIIPTMGMNIKRNHGIVHKTSNDTYSNCPIKVPGKYISSNCPPNACIISIFNDIDNKDYSGVINKNDEKQKQEIKEIIGNPNTRFAVHKLSRPSNREKIPKLLESFKRETEFHSGGNYEVVHIWMVDSLLEEYKELHLNDIFIEIKTSTYCLKENQYDFTTTQKEVFCVP